MLTIDNLKELDSGAIFNTGVVTDPILHRKPVRWIAKRGGYHDWAIYYHFEDKSETYIAMNGEKCTTESVIKRLVPCDDEAFKMYRR